MKRVYFVFFIFFLMSISCKKFLDLKPLDSLSPVNYYETEDQLNAALAGVYDIMGQNNLYRTYFLSRMGLDADESYYARSTQTGNVSVYDVPSSDPLVAGTWQELYIGINRANMLLANINKPVMDSANRNHIKGQALFLRAYYYFLLVSNWGPVPLLLKPIASASQFNIPRTPAKDVYGTIIEDMTEAEQLVQTAKEVGFGGRVSKSAVRGLLARVCLHMAGHPVMDVSKYADARMWAKKVMDPDQDGFQHVLNPSYSDEFIKMCQDQYNIASSIWEVEFYGNGSTVTPGFNETGGVGSYDGIAYSGTDPSIGYAYGFAGAIPRLFKLYVSKTRDSVTPTGSIVKVEYSPDTRRDWAISPYYISGTPAVKHYWPSTSIYQRVCGKWRREYEEVLPKGKSAGPTNFPLLRYSDVLLMFAEADNAINGPTMAGIDAVNQVRRRAYGNNTKADLLPGQYTDKATFLQTIQDERERELCFESLRKGDLVRWGILIPRMKLIASDYINGDPSVGIPLPPAPYAYGIHAFNDVSARDTLWPISPRELGLNPGHRIPGGDS